jgi:hypothetical protein
MEAFGFLVVVLFMAVATEYLVRHSPIRYTEGRRLSALRPRRTGMRRMPLKTSHPLRQRMS